MCFRFRIPHRCLLFFQLFWKESGPELRSEFIPSPPLAPYWSNNTLFFEKIELARIVTGLFYSYSYVLCYSARLRHFFSKGLLWVGWDHCPELKWTVRIGWPAYIVEACDFRLTWSVLLDDSSDESNENKHVERSVGIDHGEDRRFGVHRTTSPFILLLDDYATGGSLFFSLKSHLCNIEDNHSSSYPERSPPLFSLILGSDGIYSY